MRANEWVQAVLSPFLLERRGQMHIQIDQHQTVPVDMFCRIFGGALEDDSQPDKYVALSGPHTFEWGGPPQTITKTAAELGYQEHFDRWHAEGRM